jgi:hypothetical protein
MPLAASLNVFMVGFIARRLGRGRSAMVVAAFGAIAMPLLQACFNHTLWISPKVLMLER